MAKKTKKTRASHYYPESSVKQIAKVFFAVKWRPGTLNADLGGGRFDLATKYMASLGVRSIVWDPGQMDDDALSEAWEYIRDGQCDTATVANVLNITPTLRKRLDLIARAANVLKPEGIAYFQAWPGDWPWAGSRKRQKRRGGNWQLARPIEDYLPEVARFFRCMCVIPGKDIIRAMCPCPRPTG